MLGASNRWQHLPSVACNFIIVNLIITCTWFLREIIKYLILSYLAVSKKIGVAQLSNWPNSPTGPTLPSFPYLEFRITVFHMPYNMIHHTTNQTLVCKNIKSKQQNKNKELKTTGLLFKYQFYLFMHVLFYVLYL
jgi:hypothetical protein